MPRETDLYRAFLAAIKQIGLGKFKKTSLFISNK